MAATPPSPRSAGACRGGQRLQTCDGFPSLQSCRLFACGQASTSWSLPRSMSSSKRLIRRQHASGSVIRPGMARRRVDRGNPNSRAVGFLAPFGKRCQMGRSRFKTWSGVTFWAGSSVVGSHTNLPVRGSRDRCLRSAGAAFRMSDSGKRSRPASARASPIIGVFSASVRQPSRFACSALSRSFKATSAAASCTELGAGAGSPWPSGGASASQRTKFCEQPEGQRGRSSSDSKVKPCAKHLQAPRDALGDLVRGSFFRALLGSDEGVPHARRCTAAPTANLIGSNGNRESVGCVDIRSVSARL